MVNLYGTPTDPNPAPLTREAADLGNKIGWENRAKIGSSSLYGLDRGTLQAIVDQQNTERAARAAWEQQQRDYYANQQAARDRAQAQQAFRPGMKYPGWESDRPVTYEEKAREDAKNRPGWTDPATLGDSSTEAKTKGYTAINEVLGLMGMQPIPIDVITGLTLESQRQAAPTMQGKQFFAGELSKWAENYVELGGAYQNLSRKADVPIPYNPFEVQSDLARSFMMGKESNSPLTGIMDRALPGQGVQQWSWDRAVDRYRQDNPIRKYAGWEQTPAAMIQRPTSPANVNFMPAVSLLANSSGSLWDAKISTGTQGSDQGTGMALIKAPFLSYSPGEPEDPFNRVAARAMGMFGNITGNQTEDQFKTFSQGKGDQAFKFLTSWINPESPGMKAAGYIRKDSPGMMFIDWARNTTPATPTSFKPQASDKGTIDFFKKFAGVAAVTSTAGYGATSLPTITNPATMELFASNPAGWGALGGGLIVFGAESTGNLGLWGEGRVRSAGKSYAQAWNARTQSTDQTYRGIDQYLGGYFNKMTARLNESGTGMYAGSETPTRSPFRSELPAGKNQYSERPNYFPPVELPAQKRGIIEIYGNKNPNSNNNKGNDKNVFYDELGQGYPTKAPTRNPFKMPWQNPTGNETGNPTGTGNPNKNTNDNPNKNPNLFPNSNPNLNPYQFPNNDPYRYETANKPGDPGFKIDLPTLPLIGLPWGGSGSGGGGGGGNKNRSAWREMIPLQSWFTPTAEPRQRAPRLSLPRIAPRQKIRLPTIKATRAPKKTGKRLKLW